jgi:hypothetical protein
MFKYQSNFGVILFSVCVMFEGVLLVQCVFCRERTAKNDAIVVTIRAPRKRFLLLKKFLEYIFYTNNYAENENNNTSTIKLPPTKTSTTL